MVGFCASEEALSYGELFVEECFLAEVEADFHVDVGVAVVGVSDDAFAHVDPFGWEIDVAEICCYDGCRDEFAERDNAVILKVVAERWALADDFVELRVEVGNEGVDCVALIAKEVGDDCFVVVDDCFDVLLDIGFVVEETVDY